MQASIDDLECGALAHYEELSKGAHSWLSTIPHAIRFYFDAKRKAALPEIGTHTDHPLRHFDRTCPACTEGDTVCPTCGEFSNTAKDQKIDRLERLLADHRDNGRRLMEAADGWKAEAEHLRGIKRALEYAQRELAEARATIKAHEAVRDACFEALPECQAWGEVPGHIEELKRAVSTSGPTVKDSLTVQSAIEVCPNCDTTMPEGCEGMFKKDGAACLLNRTSAFSANGTAIHA